jgi:Domain of unknown function (DUF4268)
MMSGSSYSNPIIVRPDQSVTALPRVPVEGNGSTYGEDWLQNLLYAHPEAIPIDEIDESFAGIVPVCREMNTPAGSIDVLYATSSGRLVVLEAKLWRNPEARRKVVAQILDYAKELSRSSYESLDARVRSARRGETRGGGPSGLADVVRARHADLDEARFIDGVTKSLQRGDFLLLIVGDGIREGVGAITEFLEGHGTLHFTFGLIEVSIFSLPDGGHLIQPRVLAQSTIIRRIVVSIEGAQAVVTDDAPGEDSTGAPDVSDEVLETRKQFSAFWDEFLGEFKPRLQDQSQSMPNGSRSQNLYFYMPKPSHAWVSAYVAQSAHRIGVYLTFERGPIGDRLYAALESDKVSIERELGVDIAWMSEGGKHDISCRKEYSGTILKEHRASAQEWFADRLNRFITTFRPRIEQLIRDQQIL